MQKQKHTCLVQFSHFSLRLVKLISDIFRNPHLQGKSECEYYCDSAFQYPEVCGSLLHPFSIITRESP